MDSKEDSPDGAASAQFASQSTTAEDLLKSQTVGLVSLSDFRKRRAEIAEQKELESRDGSVSASTRGTPQPSSGAATPRQESSTPRLALKKRKKASAGIKLSFGIDEDEDDTDAILPPTKRTATGGRENQALREEDEDLDKNNSAEGESIQSKRRIGPNTSIANAPKIMTKAALSKEAGSKERIRREFLATQEAVRNTEILIPFVFFDGTNVPGGMCKIKKGDPVWLFLDRARKVGAELGASGEDKARKDWARISVDDLMLVRDDIIIPPHYNFHYFMVNKTCGYQGLLFNYSSKPLVAAVSHVKSQTGENALSRPKPASQTLAGQVDAKDAALEGVDHDPSMTKVVDRRWYEKNKHIYPASIWEEFDPEKVYTQVTRRDPRGNAFFFS